LFVDDHEPTCSALTQLLLRRAYKVIIVGSIAEARRWLPRRILILIVSDIGLLDGNGYDLMTELQKMAGSKASP
jgi:DNA-binding NtrC family response regulator